MDSMQALSIVTSVVNAQRLWIMWFWKDTFIWSQQGTLEHFCTKIHNYLHYVKNSSFISCSLHHWCHVICHREECRILDLWVSLFGLVSFPFFLLLFLLLSALSLHPSAPAQRAESPLSPLIPLVNSVCFLAFLWQCKVTLISSGHFRNQRLFCRKSKYAQLQGLLDPLLKLKI